ncbi:MAG: hypothetical protein ACTHK7_09280 [Aureliella sp.]
MATINVEDYMTTHEFAEKLGDGTQVDTISLYCSKGIINGMRLGRSWLIHRKEFDRFKLERRSRGRPKKAV